MTNKIEIYKTKDKKTEIEVQFEKDTVWLTQAQMVVLFDSSKANISEHIKNIYSNKELTEGATVRKFRTVQTEGSRQVTRDRDHYNLDMIISVGYRVNSKRGVQFRQWATQRLKDYLVQGYAINEKRLQQKQQEVEYLKTGIRIVSRAIEAASNEIEEKAANLLYFITKNHSFVDGNKRIAAACFLLFLEQNNALTKTDGSLRIENNTLAALTLFIATSKSDEADIVKRLIISILNRNTQ